jgi:hypothetical protein
VFQPYLHPSPAVERISHREAPARLPFAAPDGDSNSFRDLRTDAHVIRSPRTNETVSAGVGWIGGEALVLGAGRALVKPFRRENLRANNSPALDSMMEFVQAAQSHRRRLL